MAQNEGGWKHRHKSHQKKGVPFSQVNVHLASPSPTCTMPRSLMPHSIFYPFSTLKNKQTEEARLKAEHNAHNHHPSEKSTIG
jgi:hypothetical protein